PPTVIYTLSLHDALPISRTDPNPHPNPSPGGRGASSGRETRGLSTRRADSAQPHAAAALHRHPAHPPEPCPPPPTSRRGCRRHGDRKSTRLNSSHVKISY